MKWSNPGHLKRQTISICRMVSLKRIRTGAIPICKNSEMGKHMLAAIAYMLIGQELLPQRMVGQ